MSFCRGDGRCEICDPPIRQDPDEIEDNGMTLREEFARDIFLADNSSFPEAAAQKDWDENREHHDYAFEIADRLIAKGYGGRVTR